MGETPLSAEKRINRDDENNTVIIGTKRRNKTRYFSKMKSLI